MAHHHTSATASLRRLAAIGVLCLVVGCETSGPSGVHFAVRRLPRADRVSVFQASREALIGMGFTMDRVDPDAGVLTTLPARDGTLESRARAEVLGQSATVRRVATIRIESSGEDVAVYCKIEMQEPATEAHRMRAAAVEGSDLPSETPIDRDAATTPEQNAVWHTVGRDREMERSLLDLITQASGVEGMLEPAP